MLDEQRKETLDRPEQRSVDHDRPVPGVVLTDVVHVESLRKLSVDLDSRHLPGPADRIARLDRDLRTVERASAWVETSSRSIVSAACRSASVASSHSSKVPTAFSAGIVESSR